MELLYRNYHKIVASQVLFTHGNLSENRAPPNLTVDHHFSGLWSSGNVSNFQANLNHIVGSVSLCVSSYIYISNIYIIYIYIIYIYNIYIYIISPWSPHFCCLKLCCLLHPLALGLRNDFVEADGSLPVAGAEEIIPTINKLVNEWLDSARKPKDN